METKQVSIDGGLHFNAEVQDDGHVTYTITTATGEEPLASYCPDTQELVLFEVTSERQATEVIQTQLNHTTAGVLGRNPLLAMMVDLSELFGDEADRG